MPSSTTEVVVCVVGIVGGVLLTGAIVPRIHRAHVLRSSTDISYVYHVRNIEVSRTGVLPMDKRVAQDQTRLCR